MSLRPPRTLVALLGPALEVALQLRWAVRLAIARKPDLLILHRMESREERTVEVSFDEPVQGKATGVINEVRRMIEEM